MLPFSSWKVWWTKNVWKFMQHRQGYLFLSASINTMTQTNMFIKKANITKEFLSIIDWIYYWRLFCTSHEHYNYLQLTQLIKMEINIQKIIKIDQLNSAWSMKKSKLNLGISILIQKLFRSWVILIFFYREVN